MIITATSNKEAKEVKKVLVALGYKYKYSIYWSEEWNKGDKVVFLHKGYNNRGDINPEWRGYVA